MVKADIDSFLIASSRHRVIASSRDEFTHRYIFDTARAWSGNATATLEGLEPASIDASTLVQRMA